MKRFGLTALGSQRTKSWMLAAVLTAALAGFLAPRAAAQGDGTISGQILDVTGKPWIDLVIQMVSDQGAKAETKTDKDGGFLFRNLRSGVYTIYIQLPAPNKPYEVQVRAQGGQNPPIKLNFKDIVAQQGAEYAEQQKKQEEEKQKFKGMKEHFDAGVVLLDQAKQAKTDLAKASGEQRDTLKGHLAELSSKAVTEFETAQKAAPEKDPNLHLIWARLGDAYDSAGRSEEAINAYQQAVALKPSAAYYNNLGGVLGRAGKIEDATSAYKKSAELDPVNAAQAWRNFGITLYNAGRLKEAIEPLKKAT